MANVRVTISRRPRAPGSEVGVTVNTFKLTALEGITGEELEPILYVALTPSFEDAKEAWPVLTGASKDSMRLETVELTDRVARVALKVGGDQLKEDPRNESGKDYAPYIEFNGTKTTPPGTIAYAITTHRRDIQEIIHAGVKELVQNRLRTS